MQMSLCQRRVWVHETLQTRDRVTTGKPRHRQRHDNSKTKALIGQQVHDWRAGSRRNIALEAIERGTARIPLGCHAEINKSALIGQVRALLFISA